MRPHSPNHDELFLFQSHFDQQLNPSHALVVLSKRIDWNRFETAFSDCYCPDFGAPAKSVRLMVGLHYLKHTFNESDESVVSKWVENPYWQYFCGYTHLQHTCPIHPTSMTKWRQRVGAERLSELLKETVSLAVREKHLPSRELQHVTVDTTVQEKNITYPTDSKLLYKAIEQLNVAAQTRLLRLRQSYLRVGKQRAVQAARYAHAKQYKRMRRSIRSLRTYVGRLIRDIGRKTMFMDSELKTLLERCRRLCEQRPHDKDKLYSLHEPEVCCISKGKTHKHYEFGQKVALATTNRRDWFVAAELMAGNPYDGHTLAKTIAAVEANTGVALSDVYVDKGYRGHDYRGEATVHLAGANKKDVTRTQQKRRRRRSAIEPKIGHAKQENRLGRCYLHGLSGDAMNVTLAAAGANFRKLLRLRTGLFFVLLKKTMDWLYRALPECTKQDILFNN